MAVAPRRFCYRIHGSFNDAEGERADSILKGSVETPEIVCHSSPLEVTETVEYFKHKLTDKDSSIQGTSIHVLHTR